jgi:hypothetical protein
MDFVKATQKITDCIESAETSEHHRNIDRMIETVTQYARIQKSWDKSLKGALALLDWQNVNKFNKFHKKFGS